VTKLIAALGFLALNFYVYNFLASDAVYPERKTFDQFPNELEEAWTCRRTDDMNEDVRAVLGVTDWLTCNFVNPEREAFAGVYVGYHESQVREDGAGTETAIHPPAHCLPGSGWDIIKSTVVPLGDRNPPYPGATARRLIIAKGRTRQLVYYWYQSRGRVISEDWKKILYVGLDRATRNRTDGALVRFTVPVFQGDEAAAERVFDSLAPLVLTRLPAYVPD
jgi:EpsI family protein